MRGRKGLIEDIGKKALLIPHHSSSPNLEKHLSRAQQIPAKLSRSLAWLNTLPAMNNKEINHRVKRRFPTFSIRRDCLLGTLMVLSRFFHSTTISPCTTQKIGC
jgi:hypothetical protein